MDNKNQIFINSEGVGGFEQGLYDDRAPQPTASNWTRQSCYKIPDKPFLLWKAGRENAYLGGTHIGGSFAITGKKSVIVSQCSNKLFNEDGKLLEISDDGTINELFIYNQKFGIPVIGANGIIYIYTIGGMNSTGHKLFCLNPDGTIKWEYVTGYSVHDRPVIDKDGNIYLFTYGDVKGNLTCLSKDGILNWEYYFKSINWCDPMISKDEIVYVGLNVSQSLCAFNKKGELFWEKPGGLGLGSRFMNIKDDGTIYVCYSSALHALSSDGELKWTYKPERTNMHMTPALGRDGRLYLNRRPNLLVSLDGDGNELWKAEIKDIELQAPIIGSDGRIMQISYIKGQPLDKSWIQIFTPEGELLWEYTMDGIIMSAYLADNNLIYAITNIYDRRNWKDSMKVKWEIHAIGEL
jgi:outer membrane protein assembly factor BamB